jgi:hypothetical protein
MKNSIQLGKCKIAHDHKEGMLAEKQKSPGFRRGSKKDKYENNKKSNLRYERVIHKLGKNVFLRKIFRMCFLEWLFQIKAYNAFLSAHNQMPFTQCHRGPVLQIWDFDFRSPRLLGNFRINLSLFPERISHGYFFITFW